MSPVRWPQLLLLMVLVVFLPGCPGDDVDVTSPPRAPTAPVIDGIWAITEDGVELGAVGNAADGGLRAYPNPHSYHSTTTIRFEVPEPAQVSVWVVRGIGPGESRSPDLFTLGAFWELTAQGALTRVLLDRKPLGGGHSLVEWDGRSDSGDRVPPGVYRVYVDIDGAVRFADVCLIDPEHPPHWIPCWALVDCTD